MTFYEMEKYLYAFALNEVTNKKASVENYTEENFLLFDDFVNILCKYNNECVKIAETHIYNVLTLKDAKAVINAFKKNLHYATAAMQQIQELANEKQGNIYEFIAEANKVKIQFENIMSCIENYLFKYNHREYEIIQDREINGVCLGCLNTFDVIIKYIPDVVKYQAFINDIQRIYNRYYKAVDKIQTFNLKDADVVNKTKL